MIAEHCAAHRLVGHLPENMHVPELGRHEVVALAGQIGLGLELGSGFGRVVVGREGGWDVSSGEGSHSLAMHRKSSAVVGSVGFDLSRTDLRVDLILDHLHQLRQPVVVPLHGEAPVVRARADHPRVVLLLALIVVAHLRKR